MTIFILTTIAEGNGRGNGVHLIGEREIKSADIYFFMFYHAFRFITGHLSMYFSCCYLQSCFLSRIIEKSNKKFKLAQKRRGISEKDDNDDDHKKFGKIK